MIKISPKAKDYIIQSLKEKQQKNIAIDIIKGGCSGMQYKFFYTSEINEDDEKIVIEDDFKLIIKPHALLFTIGTELDYEQTPTGAKLVFKTLNASYRCGCGKSFAY